MVYFTTNTYTLKREILNFSNKISKQLSKPERKFTADMTYGMLAAGSCFLTDVVKSGGYKFESLGIVRDDSESTSAKNVYKKGYHVTEACVLTTGNHPVSIFSKVHSSAEKGYKSANTVTFETTELRNRRKGKIKTNVFYKGKNHEAYISHVKVQITASRKDIYLVLVYGITEHPMMLATNKEIKSKEDVIKVARTYFSRWKIEEYFRCKKQIL